MMDFEREIEGAAVVEVDLEAEVGDLMTPKTPKKRRPPMTPKRPSERRPPVTPKTPTERWPPPCTNHHLVI